jgi:S-adenosylmethionine:tRNA ribosyltransferase-isomerase
VLVTEFDFHLPPDLIAQSPAPERAAARMLHLERETGAYTDRRFRDLSHLLRPGDVLVLNNTKVFPARLYGRRSGQHAQPVSARNPAAKGFLAGQVEVLLTSQNSAAEWQALVRPGRKIGVGERLTFGDHELHAEVVARGAYGERTLRFDVPDEDSFFAAVEKLGHVPLPPYIDRPDAATDRDRYQTVFAKQRGSAAAPTAGLHFTPEVLEEMRKQGVEVRELTLHVGLGTFQPLRQERVEDNRLHKERYSIPSDTADAIANAKRDGRRVIAVGTTTVRTLEYSASQNGGAVEPGSGEAEIFIYPGFRFQVIDALLTNFHLPQSSLLMLVCAFAGKENVLRAYEHAVQERYRFFSYGDCMFIE